MMSAVYVQGIGNFVDAITGGLILVALAVVVGGVLWAFFMLRVGRGDVADPALARRCAGLVRAGAIALGVTQLLKLATKAIVLASALGGLPVAAYAGTMQVQAGFARALMAFAIALVARKLIEASDHAYDEQLGTMAPKSQGGNAGLGLPPDCETIEKRTPHAGAVTSHRETGEDLSPRAVIARWRSIALLAVPLVLSGAGLVHAVGRLEHRGVLMALTLVHQFAAAVWIGGVFQLLALRALRRRVAAAEAFWPVAIARFSILGITSVVALLATGLVLTLAYVGSLEGMVGTGYGSLVVAKLLLLALALGFAVLNFNAGRAWARDRSAPTVVTRVPRYIESETFVLVTILFVAASLSSMPPAADIRGLTATGSEVLAMFQPRVPSLESPTHAALLAGEAKRLAVVDRVPSAAATGWSDYNHNVAGVFLLVIGAVGALSYLPGFGWARFWPAGFMLLGLFLFFRSDAESWPLGPIGFWESTLGNAEVLQHRLATLLAFTLGALETRARAKGSAGSRLRYMFPLLCALGGLLLLTHAHLPFEIKTDYLIQSTHLVMGLLAVVMAVGRWLELRLADGGDLAQARLAGIVSVAAMLAISYVLIVYKEPLY